MTNRRQAFTLIELLVVCAIIGILIAMIFPIYNYILSRGRQTACMNNLRQLGAGFELYKNAWKGFYPHEDRDSLPKGTPTSKGNFSWFDVLDPYLDQKNLSRVKQCAAWEGYDTDDIDFNTADLHSIKMNSKLENGVDQSPLAGGTSPPFPSVPASGYYYWFPVNRAKKPQKTLLLMDGRVDSGQGGQIRTHIGNVSNRHFGGTNLLFVDLHVEYFDATGEGVANADGLGWKNEGPFIWDPFTSTK